MDERGNERVSPDSDDRPAVEIDVRELRAGDLDRIVRIDRAITGNDRSDYLKRRVASALEESGIKVSLAAEVDGTVVGFLLGRVDHGEYGRLAASATIDTIGVAPDFRGRGVGHALFDQLALNLQALRVERVQTEVEWEQWDLMTFLRGLGFRPAPRLALDLELGG